MLIQQYLFFLREDEKYLWGNLASSVTKTYTERGIRSSNPPNKMFILRNLNIYIFNPRTKKCIL